MEQGERLFVIRVFELPVLTSLDTTEIKHKINKFSPPLDVW